ncbi:MAG: MBL fold metallo-hydrolase, partial [Pseudobutyrivibrio sp.]|nr:MBL fold metallo-hydrolase [Pseudobutyrivibrio sp.]
KVYQANQIGGCVTVITAEVDGATHRIMIDYGRSLKGHENAEEFFYPWNEDPIDAVFFTHYHGDHVGRLLEIPKEIPLYIGSAARQVMINIQRSLANMKDTEEAEIHQQELEVLMDDDKVHTFNWNGSCYDAVELPGFRVEPYSVDHSAYDAYMFLIEVSDDAYEDGKKVILHTGDFRGHGRRGKAMIPVIKKYVHANGRQVHSLITEGTMMSRLTEKVKTETEMMHEAEAYLKKHKYTFLICSSTNLDSLASFYQAAQTASKPYGRYMYVYNTYFKTQLQTFSDTAGSFSDVYQFHNVHKLDLNRELKSDKWDKSMSQKKLMEITGFLAVIKPEEWCEDFVEPFIEDYKAGSIDEMPVIIYSMWEGYVNPKHEARKQDWIDFLDNMKSKGVEVKHLHTSGHAAAGMLRKVIKAVAPTEEIIPMHTENALGFLQLDIGEDLKRRCRL